MHRRSNDKSGHALSSFTLADLSHIVSDDISENRVENGGNGDTKWSEPKLALYRNAIPFQEGLALRESIRKSDDARYSILRLCNFF